jgi:carbon storage regulator CsrA
MLVLSRKQNEKVLIDGGITVEVLQIQGNKVRLGITAPSDVKVMRGELKPYGMSVVEMQFPQAVAIAG